MYPNEIDKFNEKLNKLENNIYTIEEEVTVINGVYESELKHDNANNKTIRVYTGSKLSGEKVDNVLLSTPSDAPWKRLIKIFSNVSPLFITYETPGDTVEAEDINNLQDSVVKTQTEIDRYKNANDLEVENLKEKDKTLEQNKAEKTYVDTELNNRYTKDRVFTKEEVLQKIQDLINNAPDVLDTFAEIATALGNDPNFATTITTMLANKVDKVQGKQLTDENYSLAEKNKVAGVQANANNYSHPSTHLPSVIAQDANNRFVTDAEKSNWSSKAPTNIVTTTINGLMSKEDKAKLNSIADNANNYTHPQNHPASMITGLSTVATTGSYKDLNESPTIPTKLSQLENDTGIGGLPSKFTWAMLKGV